MERKIAQNSAVKTKETTRREMNTSKSGKTAAQSTPSLNLDLSVLMGTDWGVHPRMLQGSEVVSGRL